jgi:hypothetical protein
MRDLRDWATSTAGACTSLIDFRACGTACGRNKAQAQCIHNGGSFSRPCVSSANLHLGATNGINRAGLCPKASVGFLFTRRSNFRPTGMNTSENLGLGVHVHCGCLDGNWGERHWLFEVHRLHYVALIGPATSTPIPIAAVITLYIDGRVPHLRCGVGIYNQSHIPLQ